MENFKILGRRAKYLRMDRGISQTKMAFLMGLSQTNLSNMESGRTVITTQNLFKMREILRCKLADFFVDFDGTKEEENKELNLEDAVQILRLLRDVKVKGL